MKLSLSKLTNPKGSKTSFWESADKDYMIAAGTAIVSTILVVPRLNAFLDKHTNNTRYSGIAELAIGIFLVFIALRLSDGWAALMVGLAFAIILEGASRAIFPTLSATADATGAPAISGVLAHYLPA